MRISLSNSHLCMEAGFVESFFGAESHALVSLDEKKKKLLLARGSSEWFRKMHNAQPYLLKTKNMKGDRSLALHALFIDNDLDSEDRDLVYEVNDKAGWVKVDLNVTQG